MSYSRAKPSFRTAIQFATVAIGRMLLVGIGLLLVGNVVHAQGVVSSATPESTDAGVEILRKGGNAIDAAVAVSLTLAVTEPAGSGVAGQTFMLVHPPGGKPFVIHGASLAPSRLPVKIKTSDISGRRATTIPSTLRVLEFAWKKYGSGKITWKQLVEPALRAAENGYKLGYFRHRTLLRYAGALGGDAVTKKMYLGENGKIPSVGEVVRSPQLVAFLKRLADAGAGDFYRGQIAREIAADMKAHGGWITLADLESFPPPNIVTPLYDKYRGYDVYTLPPPTGGWVVLLALNILERAPQKLLSAENRDSRSIWMAETLRIGHASRSKSPVTDFKDYAVQIAKKISDNNVDQIMKNLTLPKVNEKGGETTHFSIVDPDGMAVGVTASINAYFGAQVAHPKWGFLYNNYMNEFVVNEPDAPYNLRPGAMPYSSMSATILAKKGQPLLVVGSPGSRRIISAVVQVTSHWVDVHDGIKNAVGAFRLHVTPEEGDLHVEAPQRFITPELLLKLELRGFNVVRPFSSLFHKDLNPFFGGVHAVAKEAAGWTGAADPRRDGTVGLVK